MKFIYIELITLEKNLWTRGGGVDENKFIYV